MEKWALAYIFVRGASQKGPPIWLEKALHMVKKHGENKGSHMVKNKHGENKGPHMEKNALIRCRKISSGGGGEEGVSA